MMLPTLRKGGPCQRKPLAVEENGGGRRGIGGKTSILTLV